MLKAEAHAIVLAVEQDELRTVYSKTGRGHIAHRGYNHTLFIPQRVALTEAQVEEFDLPTAPPKASDSRSANWYGETTQAEAMPPTLLEEVVTGAVDELTDPDALAAVEEQEEDDKERLRAAVEDMSVQDFINDRGLDNPSLLDLVSAIAARDLED